MSTATLTRPPRAYTAKPQRTPTYEAGEDGSLTRFRKRRWAAKKDHPPLMQKVGLAAQVYGIQGVRETMTWFQGWREYFYPPVAGRGPNIVKAYEARPGLAVRYALHSPPEPLSLRSVLVADTTAAYSSQRPTTSHPRKPSPQSSPSTAAVSAPAPPATTTTGTAPSPTRSTC